MSDFVHGEMDINQHRDTWSGFCVLVKWSCILIAIVLIALIPYLAS